MTRERERKPWLRLSDLSRAFAVVVAVVLATASAASGIGVVFAGGDSSAEKHSMSGSESALPLPGDDRSNDSARGTLPGPREPTTRSGNSSDDPPSDPPKPNETTAPSPTTAPNTTAPDKPTSETTTGTPGDSPVNPTSVPEPNTTVPGDPPENGTEPPADPGPPENRTDPPSNGTGAPGNGTVMPGNGTGVPDNGKGIPNNETGVPNNGTGVPGNRTGLPGNATERPENATGPANRSERAGREFAPNASAPSVNVTVPNATANQSVSVNVSETEATDADVAFSAVNVTPTRNGSFTLNVTASEAPITGKTPTRNLTNGTEPLAFLSVDHSIEDRNISGVTFQFRVDRDRVNDSERDEIAMYRYHGETWNELPTELVKTTESHYVYQVRSPGLSEFAAGKQRPQFEITNATVELSTLSVGDALKVQVRITNEGDADGTFAAELVLSGESVASRQLTIAAGGMRQTTFERRVSEPGTYEVYVNDFRVGEVVVDESEVSGDDSTSSGATEGEATDDGESTDQNTSASVPGLGAVAGVLALLATLLAVWRKQ